MTWLVAIRQVADARPRGGRPGIALATRPERIITTKAEWHQERADTNLKAQVAPFYRYRFAPNTGRTWSKEEGWSYKIGAEVLGVGVGAATERPSSIAARAISRRSAS
jgi:hypothetical protein